MEKEEKKGKNKALTVIGILFLLSFLVFGFLYIREKIPYWQGNKAYDKISQQVVKIKTPVAGDANKPGASNPGGTGGEGGAQTGEGGGSQSPGESAAPGQDGANLTPEQLDLIRIKAIIEIDFEQLKAINPDIVGWIYSEGTNINYPILKGPNNYFYLNRLYDKTINRLGSIFMEQKNKVDFSDDTTVLFGHNMLDDSMFASLEEYRKEGYYEKHPYLYIFTPEMTFRVDVFAGYVVKAEDFGSLHQNMKDLDEKRAFVAEAVMRSNFETKVQFEEDDRFVSLFTCNYDYTDSRYVVQGKLVPLTP